MNPIDVIKYPLSTEKSIRLMEAENKMIFVVDNKATKADVKKAVEQVLKGKVVAVNTTIMPDGKKKAYVKFAPDTLAMDVATNLGLM